MAAPLHCLVEIPKGSRNKYEWDDELGGDQARPLPLLLGRLSRPTTASSRTRSAEDGDPLDAMVCVSEPTFPGCVIPVKAVAVFRMRRRQGPGRQDPLRAARGPELELHARASTTCRGQLRSRSSTSSRSTSSPRARRSRSTAGTSATSRMQLIEESPLAARRRAPDPGVRAAWLDARERAPRRLVRVAPDGTPTGPDADLPVFARSAVKPLQALGSVRAGVLERFGLATGTSRWPAPRTAAGRRTSQSVAEVLQACGLAEDALGCGPELPRDPREARRAAGADPPQLLRQARVRARPLPRRGLAARRLLPRRAPAPGARCATAWPRRAASTTPP